MFEDTKNMCNGGYFYKLPCLESMIILSNIKFILMFLFPSLYLSALVGGFNNI